MIDINEELFEDLQKSEQVSDTQRYEMLKLWDK